MNSDDLFNKWNVWLEVIYDDVQGLLINRQIYQETQELILSNAKIQLESAYYEWTAIMYASTQATGVRRQVDPRADVISFANLLGEITEKPEVLSRQRYVALHAETASPKGTADQGFDPFAGAGKPHVDPKMAAKDLTEMKQKADKIRMYVNKRIIRFDGSDFQSPPTLGELDDALDFLDEALKKYLNLFRARHHDTIVPPWGYDWKKIFQVPWIE